MDGSTRDKYQDLHALQPDRRRANLTRADCWGLNYWPGTDFPKGGVVTWVTFEALTFRNLKEP